MNRKKIRRNSEKIFMKTCSYDSGIVFLIDECFMRKPYRVVGEWIDAYINKRKIQGYTVAVGYDPKIIPIDGIDYVQLDPKERFPIFELKSRLNFPSATILFTNTNSNLYKELNCDLLLVQEPRENIEKICQTFAESLDLINSKYLWRFNIDRAATASNDVVASSSRQRQLKFNDSSDEEDNNDDEENCDWGGVASGCDDDERERKGPVMVESCDVDVGGVRTIKVIGSDLTDDDERISIQQSDYDMYNLQQKFGGLSRVKQLKNW